MVKKGSLKLSENIYETDLSNTQYVYENSNRSRDIGRYRIPHRREGHIMVEEGAI